MKILVLNGSPRGTAGNTWQLTRAFIEGMKMELGTQAAVKTLTVSAMRLEPCRGCFHCWTVSPGSCVIQDDMAAVLDEMIAADLIVWSFPLYYFGMPGPIKTLLDRCLPLNLPWIESGPDGRAGHPRRYPEAQAETLLISTCGFYTIENNVEALSRQFDLAFGECHKLFCPEGELFSHPELRAQTSAYLAQVKQAGQEYARTRTLSAHVLKRLSEPLIPRDAFLTMANASWEIAKPEGQITDGAQERERAERFTRQMAALYNPAGYDGKQRVFEIFYTDVQIGYQLVLKEACELREVGSGAYTTRVETPLSVWQAIAKGEIRGDQAMMEGQYKTQGDLSLLMDWDRIFSGPDSDLIPDSQMEPKKKTNMLLLIIPWCTLWMLMPFSASLGGSAAVLSAAFLALASRRWELTLYDGLTGVFAGLLGLLALHHAALGLLVPLSYLIFGLLWLFSCLSPVPLSAHYSKENYHREAALQNPVFMKTNRILTCLWGLLYLLSAAWTFMIMRSSTPVLAALINTLCPLVMGLFTVWFEKWYPAKIARG